MVHAQRFHQGGSLFLHRVVVARLWTIHRRLNRTGIAYAMQTAEQLDEAMLHAVDFGHRKVLAHLFGQPLKQFTISGHGLLERIHHFATHQMLRGHDIVEIEA